MYPTNDEAAPANSGASTPGESRLTQPAVQNRLETTIMTSTPNVTPDVAPPEGADPDDVDPWETDNDNMTRLVWSYPVPQPGLFGCDVRVVASQRSDGTIITDVPSQEAVVYIDGEDFSLWQARVLALALIEAVDLAERWGTAK